MNIGIITTIYLWVLLAIGYSALVYFIYDWIKRGE